ncbi:restriction endonuclease subunit S [Butyrivibrio sp. MB2005]|uniref:restriction endonuclease subunit S n=1 Tax=Butyrivibrio sp. MB2005 TaxID=1280678 RepID=UPI00040C7D53|nr:restriction endonuclease subunit S [Butyrivibrio sp. MB2005]
MDKVRLGDIATLINGDRGKNYPSQADITDEGDIPFVNAGHLNGRGIDFEEMNYISQEKYDCLSSGKFIKGDVLYCLRGSLGKKAIVNDDVKGAIASSLVIIRPDYNRIDGDYLMFSLDSPSIKEQLIKANNGSSQPNLSAASVREYQIELPDMQIQKAVVEKLAKVREAIDNRQCELDLLDLLIKARFVELFGDPVLNEKGWETRPFLDMGSCKNGMNFHYDDSGVELNCLGVGDFKDYSVITNTELLPTVSLNEIPSEEYLLRDDDIVFVRSNGNKALVGRSVAVYPGNTPTTFSGFCIRYRKHDDGITIPYLLRVLKADSIRKKMVGRGANIQNLNQQILGTLIIPVPPLDLQKQFADFVEQVDKSKVAVQKALKKDQLLFDSLMQEYFG